MKHSVACSLLYKYRVLQLLASLCAAANKLHMYCINTGRQSGTKSVQTFHGGNFQREKLNIDVSSYPPPPRVPNNDCLAAVVGLHFDYCIACNVIDVSQKEAKNN